MQKNARLLKMGDLIEGDSGRIQVVRSVTMILHLADGSDMAVDVPADVETLDADEIEGLSEEVVAQIESLQYGE